MKRIGLMTLNSRMYNYGGILQEFALSAVLENMGANVEIIDFDTAGQLYTFSAKRSLVNLEYRKVLSRIIEKLPRRPDPHVQSCVAKRHAKFDEFREECLNLSPRYNHETIHQTQNIYDALVCGSDQIWNPDFNHPQLFLSFGSPAQKKVIYGASVGRTELTRHQMKEYKKLLNYPDTISTREKSAKELLQPLTEKAIHVVLDPTMLLEKDQWEQTMSPRRLVPEKYVFCYFLGNNTKKQSCAKRLAAMCGAKIVTLPFLLDKYEKESVEFGDYQLSEIGPREFLRLIHDAHFVLTDSFHATLFSILFRKDFWVFSRNIGTYNMNTRLDTLLDYFDLRKQMVEADDAVSCPQCAYEDTYQAFEEAKAFSLRYLAESLELNQ